MQDNASSVATDEQMNSRSRDVEWYQKELKRMPEAMQELLVEYSKIPSDKVRDHVIEIVSVVPP